MKVIVSQILLFPTYFVIFPQVQSTILWGRKAGSHRAKRPLFIPNHRAIYIKPTNTCGEINPPGPSKTRTPK